MPRLAEQHEIARIIDGKHNWFILRYTVKVHELPPNTRTKWVKTFEAATVDSDAQSGGPLDVESVIPFERDKVMAALKPAMESADCNVKETAANRVECKRPRGSSGYAAYGCESLTAVLEAQGSKTRVQNTTGKGFYGRLAKRSWSIPIYQRMMKGLEQAQP